MTPFDWAIMIGGAIGLLVCIVGYASTFIPTHYWRKKNR